MVRPTGSSATARRLDLALPSLYWRGDARALGGVYRRDDAGSRPEDGDSWRYAFTAAADDLALALSGCATNDEIYVSSFTDAHGRACTFVYTAREGEGFGDGRDVDVSQLDCEYAPPGRASAHCDAPSRREWGCTTAAVHGFG